MSQPIFLLTLQHDAAIISLFGAFLVILVVLFLIITSSKAEDGAVAKKKVYKLRGRYFFGLIIVLIILSFISLRMLPYPKSQSHVDEVVTVVGVQWAWKMANGVSDQSPTDFKGKDELTVPVNKAIKFIVTSADVNHDFSIYNNKGVLQTQVQVMPQYKNEIIYTFHHKGDYPVLCLEYCGLAHAFMMGTIHVR